MMARHNLKFVQKCLWQSPLEVNKLLENHLYKADKGRKFRSTLHQDLEWQGELHMQVLFIFALIR